MKNLLYSNFDEYNSKKQIPTKASTGTEAHIPLKGLRNSALASDKNVCVEEMTTIAGS